MALLFAFYDNATFSSVNRAPVEAVAADEFVISNGRSVRFRAIHNIRLALCRRCGGCRSRGSGCRRRGRCSCGGRLRYGCCGGGRLRYGCCRGGRLCRRGIAALCGICTGIFIGACLDGGNVFLHSEIVLGGMALIFHGNGGRAGRNALYHKARRAAGAGRYGDNAFVRRGIGHFCGIGGRCFIRCGVHFRRCRIANIQQTARAGQFNACYAVCGSGAGGSGFACAGACRGAFGCALCRAGNAFAFGHAAFDCRTACRCALGNRGRCGNGVGRATRSKPEHQEQCRRKRSKFFHHDSSLQIHSFISIVNILGIVKRGRMIR